ncbi:MAG: DNA polymerase III subunit alpha [Thiomargarita sp.]|nr:DNA polymerase III subunit alpha [Thiomargarita sp.]
MPNFVHLHLHTEYALVDSLIRIKPLVKAVRKAGMPACAVTDYSNLFALVKFYRAAQSEGIKPIIGVDVRLHQGAEPASRLVLLCQNEIGYRNLTRLVSRSYTEGQENNVPYLHRQWLNGATEGIIALSGGCEGEIGQALLAEDIHLAKQRLNDFKLLFPQRFYIELQRTGRLHEEEYIHAAVELALETDIPVVATNDVCFLNSNDFESHEVRVCIHDSNILADKNRPRRYSEQQYLRTPQEMAELFSDIPEAIENTWLIAQRCNLELTLGKNFLPDFPIPEGETVEEYFRNQARIGLEQRLAFLFDRTTEKFTAQRRPYDERLVLELDVIIKMGFPGYFLIVADFIQWAKENDIPVGPGRGSGAGSLVAYALKITDLDPIHYELLFERFLNPERVSMPDFDIDFCIEGRDDVINYVAERYGRERVSQIITYGTMAAKAVVRDVGRVLAYPHGFVDKIAKLIPFEIGITLDKALEKEDALSTLYDEEEDVRALINMARQLEGLTRNSGKHAGGVVIAPSVLTDFTPLYCEQDSSDLMTQFDKGDVEAVGLVKFDFLGLRTLTIIKWALKTINHFAEKPIDILKLPLDDPETYNLLKRGDTTAVFQLESSGIKKLIRRLRPDCFEEIIALVALYRPGPLQSGMVDDFIERKQGRAKVEYPHPDLAPILKPTYGVMVYQEQVMQIAQVLAGYSLGGADLLRRAMGKKIAKEMDKQRSVFVEGATKRGVKEKVATYVFDLIDKFSGYGFNRSHSAAYALLAYQTAWLKAHYPAAFMAAVLSADMDNTDKVVSLIDECRAMKLKVLPPNINVSHYKFTVADDQNKSIHYGLGAIKGAGEAALEGIVTEREEKGRFTDLFYFCNHIDLRKASRRILEPLIKTGALDELGPNRAVLMASLDSAIKSAERHSTDSAAGQNDIFGGRIQKSTQEEPPFVKDIQEWSQTERLKNEKEGLGFYLSGHPITPYLLELAQLVRATRLSAVKPTEKKQTVRVAGWVTDLRINTKRGRMAFITLDDSTARMEVKIYSELYATARDLLVKDTLLIVEGEVRVDDYNDGYTMTAKKISTLETAREQKANRLELSVPTQNSNELAQKLVATLKSHLQGQCRVFINYQHQEAQIELQLDDNWKVKANTSLIDELKGLLGEDSVKVR